MDVTGATEVVDATFIAGIGPNYEMTVGKVDAGNMELNAVNVGVGTRFGGIDTGMTYINLAKASRVGK
ncbi:hypothetical protein KI387_038305, partial [Taxus chinensis]